MATAELAVPPLSPGDNLSREEFLERWELEPDIKRAELIGGVVYMPSPVSTDHGDMDGWVGTWLGTCAAYTPGCASGHNATTLMLDDVPQPDVNLRLLPEYGGASWLEGKYLAGAPELLAEICHSSAAYDLHQKYDLYQAAGVQEYLTILLYEKAIRWHVLVDGAFQPLCPDANGLWRSRVFPGLWLDGQALLQGDVRGVLARLQQGIAGPDHQAFVDKLAARKS